MSVDFEAIWTSLREDSSSGADERIVRTLGDTAKGVRASYHTLRGRIELLIEVLPGFFKNFKLPTWRGMEFEHLELEIHAGGNRNHLCLSLRTAEQESVFKAFCSDLVASIEDCGDAEKRAQTIRESLERWNLFFKNTESLGLSSGRQRGLYAELEWLLRLLDNGIAPPLVIEAWKGCERRYQDVDFKGRIVEIKSTMTKEPRMVRISNERQLDPRGLLSLHLFVLTLHLVEGGGASLPETIQSVRTELDGYGSTLRSYQEKLIKAGYHDVHSVHYTDQYVIKKEELFEVRDGFPRIVDLPPGTGSLSYAVVLSDCQPYLTDMESYLNSLE